MDIISLYLFIYSCEIKIFPLDYLKRFGISISIKFDINFSNDDSLLSGPTEFLEAKLLKLWSWLAEICELGNNGSLSGIVLGISPLSSYSHFPTIISFSKES